MKTKATDTQYLTMEQRAKLASAMEVIRYTAGSLRGWSQYRYPDHANPQVVYLQRHRNSRLAEVYHICQAEPLPSK